MSKLLKFSPVVAVVSVFFPLVAFADAPLTVGDILTKIGGTFTTVIGILFILATLLFIWGVISYIISKGPDEQSKAKSLMLWGIIGLAVISAAWGFAQIIVKYFGATSGNQIPTKFN